MATSKIKKLLLLIYFIIFPLGQLIRIPIFSSVIIQPVDVVLGILVICWLFVKRGDSRLKFEYLIPFVVAAGFSLAVNFRTVEPINFLTGSFYLLRLLIYALFYFTLRDIVRRNPIWSKNLIKLLIFSGSLIVVFGFVQYFLYPDFKNLTEFGWDPHHFRLASTFFDTGFTGILIVLYLVLVSSKILDKELGKNGYLLLLLGIIALGLTYSRASYIAFAVGVGIIYIVRRNIKFTLFVLSSFALVVILLPRPEAESVRLERTSTIYTRFGDYNSTVNIINKRPLFGVGYDLLRYTRKADNYSHSASGAASSLLFVLATTGIAGLLIYLSVFLKIFKRGLGNLKNSIGLTLTASLAAVFIHSMFDNSLFYPWVLGWITILTALSDSVTENR